MSKQQTMISCRSHNLCLRRALAQAEQLCQRQALRLTALRRRVLSIVWKSHRPQKAYGILKAIGGDAKPPTVYRALDFLRNCGLVHKLQSQNAYVGCAHPGTKHTCCFLICARCGEYAECCNPQIERAIGHTAAGSNFLPQNITVEIEGLCPQCAG